MGIVFEEEEIYSCQNVSTFILQLGITGVDCIQLNLF